VISLIGYNESEPYNTPDKKGEDTVRKYLVYLLVLVVIYSTCCLCEKAAPEQPAVITENVLLYYGSEGNEEFVTEERAGHLP
jgi:hypothetical protein